MVLLADMWQTGLDLQTRERRAGLVDSNNKTNMQQEQSFSEVTWCMGALHDLWTQPSANWRDVQPFYEYET
jgi:hypothetical protein